MKVGEIKSISGKQLLGNGGIFAFSFRQLRLELGDG
jgi:hypothetical protein